MKYRRARFFALLFALCGTGGCSSEVEVDVIIELADGLRGRDAQLVVNVTCNGIDTSPILLGVADDIREYRAFARCPDASDLRVELEVFLDSDRNGIRSEREPFAQRSWDPKGEYIASTVVLDAV